MAASTDLTPGVLFYTTALSTSAADITTGPTTATRWIVTATWLANQTTAAATVTFTHRVNVSSSQDINLTNATEVTANTTIIVGPLVLSSTGNAQSLRGFAGTASAFQVIGYGYIEAV